MRGDGEFHITLGPRSHGKVTVGDAMGALFYQNGTSSSTASRATRYQNQILLVGWEYGKYYPSL